MKDVVRANRKSDDNQKRICEEQYQESRHILKNKLKEAKRNA